MATRNSGKNKLKKPLETTLGKAPSQSSKGEAFDPSHVQKPIDTSIFGLRQVLSLLQTATDEVKNYVNYECDILYECKICRSIFRSLANFILHKRKYCQDHYSNSKYSKPDETCDILKFCESHENIKNNNDNSKIVNEKRTKSISNVLDDLLINKQQNMLLTQEVLNENPNELLNSSDENNVVNSDDKCGIIILEKIEGCENALFQTKKTNLMCSGHLNTDFMKSEVMEIHSILDNDEAILGPDGKVLSSRKKTDYFHPKKHLMCAICDQKFSTKKTLSCHIKYKHNKSRLVYPCPECKDTLSNSWCVFRHLYKVHRKNSSDIKKLRDVIHSSAIIKDQESNVDKCTDLEDDKFNKRETEGQHNQQWMDDFESANDLQMCGGCGRRFERKAALHAHSQICLKRIALCNSIKEDNKHVLEEEKIAKESATTTLRGSERRKPQVLRRNLRSIVREWGKDEIYSAKHDEVICISDEEEHKGNKEETMVKKEVEVKTEVEDLQTLEVVMKKESKKSDDEVEDPKTLDSGVTKKSKQYDLYDVENTKALDSVVTKKSKKSSVSVVEDPKTLNSGMTKKSKRYDLFDVENTKALDLGITKKSKKSCTSTVEDPKTVDAVVMKKSKKSDLHEVVKPQTLNSGSTKKSRKPKISEVKDPKKSNKSDLSEVKSRKTVESAVMKSSKKSDLSDVEDLKTSNVVMAKKTKRSHLSEVEDPKTLEMMVTEDPKKSVLPEVASDQVLVTRELKSSELSMEIMKEINSQIAEVIDDIRRKRLSAEEFAEECDSGPEMPIFRNNCALSEDEDCVLISNHNRQQMKKKLEEDLVDCKEVLGVIFDRSSSTTPCTKKRKIEDQKNITDVNSNISCSKNEDASSDSDVSSPPFEAFSKLDSDDSSDSVKSAYRRSKLKLKKGENEDGGCEEKIKVVEKSYLDGRPVRNRTSTLRKDFLYDSLPISKPKKINKNKKMAHK